MDLFKYILIEKMSFQRQKFEQDKYDEAGGSLGATPTSNYGLTSPTVMSHLPSISAIIERAMTEPRVKSNLNMNFESNTQSISSMKTPFKWKFDGFQTENAPIILLGYKNRKWKNCNHFATITPTADQDTFIINLVRHFFVDFFLRISTILNRQVYLIE
jgi:hypothetical protein